MGKAVKIKSIFDPTEDEGIDCREMDPKTGEFVFHTLTKQSEKDSCDINKIMARYEKTGMLPELIDREPRYGDFSAVPTFMEAQEVVAKAMTQFEALSAHVRDRFGNDPAQMLAFCADPKNAEEMVSLGLAVKKASVPSGASVPSTQPGSSTDPAAAGAAGGPQA